MYAHTVLRTCITFAATVFSIAVAAQPGPISPGKKGLELTNAERVSELATVREISVTPSSASTARVEVEFEAGKRPEKALTNILGLRANTLARVATNPNRFAGAVKFDFAQFAREQAVREGLAKQGKKVPIFEGRQFVGFKDIEFVSAAEISKAIRTKAAFRIPIGVLTGIPTIVDPSRELMITDKSVVEDSARTFDICTNAGTPMGAWTFGKLMTDMANPAQTGTNASDFVEKWLRTWDTDQVVNGFTVAKRAQIDSILNAWPRVNGKLDLSKAPMRLLAIVNRVDLRNGGFYGGGNAGEGRFVFGVLQNCNSAAFTVILEYGVPISGCIAVEHWAQKWHALRSLALGSAAFNPALQSVTDTFAKAGAAPTKPNGSALNQLRTDEIALASPWQLREFHIQADHQLHQVVVKQTPQTSLNNTQTLTNYINGNQAQILANTYLVPLDFPAGSHFLGGASDNPLPQAPWKAAGINNNDARNKFSLNTCNACHGAETSTTRFTHISPRQAGQPASLSQFLIGDASGTLAQPTQFTMNDPVSGSPRTYGDLLRRQSDLSSLLSNKCIAGGLFREAAFVPLNMTH